MFAGINEIFISVVVEGALLMVGDSVDLDALKTVATDIRVDILPAGRDVRNIMWAVSRKWWCSFGYDYVLATIQAKFSEVIGHVQLVLL
jgi:hypothetical protein